MIPNSTVEHVSYKDDKVHLRLNNGEEVPYFFSFFTLTVLNIFTREL